MFNVGDEVMMIDNEFHEYNPKIYPAKGSIGVVVKCLPDSEPVLVDWGQDSGVDSNLHDEYAWWCGKKRLAKVNTNTQVNTQKEVCNMSKFKVGDKVVFTNAEKHEKVSQFYPVVGTVGTVKRAISDNTLLVNWGNAEGVDVWEDGTKSRWCGEDDVKPYTCEEYEYTDGEVWEMLKPKMKQFVRDVVDIDLYSPTVKNMVVAAYRSGYGRATKGRSFMIKPKGRQEAERKSIDDVLGGKMIVTFYKDDDSYNVANFAYADENGGDTRIYADIFYSSAGDAWSFGFDTISDPDCEMYVAIPFSEAIGQFDGKFVKVLRYGRWQKSQNYIKSWTIGEYSRVKQLGNKTYAVVTFKTECDDLTSYIEIYHPDYKALVPICDYLKHEGVNV